MAMTHSTHRAKPSRIALRNPLAFFLFAIRSSMMTLILRRLFDLGLKSLIGGVLRDKRIHIALRLRVHSNPRPILVDRISRENRVVRGRGDSRSVELNDAPYPRHGPSVYGSAYCLPNGANSTLCKLVHSVSRRGYATRPVIGMILTGHRSRCKPARVRR